MGLCKSDPRRPYLVGVEEGDDPGQQAAEDGHQHRLHHVVLGQALPTAGGRRPRARLPVILRHGAGGG